jgi:hypothetical protein
MKSTCREIDFTVNLSRERKLRAFSIKDFLGILSQYQVFDEINMHSHWIKSNDDIGITIWLYSSKLIVTILTTDLTIVGGLHDKIREVFQASNPIAEKSPSIRKDLKPTVFLAHRFDEQGKAYSEIMSRFLRRLGYNVLEGEGYEARDIPTKVSERIKSQDIFICLLSEGDLTWVLSETAYAKGLSKYIIVLSQANLSPNKGILGKDYEHMSFPKDFIEKAFSELLYVLPSK